ncbi:MAG: hypothetical protein MI725_10985, partial [Pirellulales bacterium]|nr:hypothetical protein [Pirellulales bacterium]
TLSLSRNAVYQHVLSLERDGLIERAGRTPSGGRPVQTYRLSEKGIEQFPKHYALMAEMMIMSVKESQGPEAARNLMQHLGEKLAAGYALHLADLDPAERPREVVRIMQKLGYAAALSEQTEKEISAYNCIFHHLAKAHEEVCSLDISLISSLLKTPVEHIECMVRGGKACRFRLEE